MCVIGFKPHQKRFEKEHLENSFYNNNDGSGFVVFKNGKLHIRKEMKNFKKLYKEYKNIAGREEDVTALWHSRIKTHGLINPENTHPFMINENIWMVHNGVITNAPDDPENRKSDTAMFAELLSNLPKNFMSIKGIFDIVKILIGDRSKVAFINTKGEVTIVNEDLGIWDSKTGCWFSNDSFRYRKYGTTYNHNTHTSTTSTTSLYHHGPGERQISAKTLYPPYSVNDITMRYLPRQNCLGLADTTISTAYGQNLVPAIRHSSVVVRLVSGQRSRFRVKELIEGVTYQNGKFLREGKPAKDIVVLNRKLTAAAIQDWENLHVEALEKVDWCQTCGFPMLTKAEINSQACYSCTELTSLNGGN